LFLVFSIGSRRRDSQDWADGIVDGDEHYAEAVFGGYSIAPPSIRVRRGKGDGEDDEDMIYTVT